MMPSWSNRRSISPLAALLVLVAAGVFGFLSGASPAVAQGTLTAPTKVTAVSNAAGELTLTWQGGDNADSFLLIAVHLETIAYETETVAGGVAKTGTVTGLTGGANYLGIVVALQASADGLATQYGAARPVAVSEHLPADAQQLMCPMPGRTVAPRPTSTVRGDYDADNDGLIEVANLAQLDAMRYDPRGRGSPSDEDLASYFGAFPNAVAGMGCPAAGCTGYELAIDLDFDTNGNGRADPGDTHWNDGAGWLPIDDYGSVFDGGGHTIANLHINREYEYDSNRRLRRYGIGLFGGMDGEIGGVALTSIDVIGTRRTNLADPFGVNVGVGGLVGAFHGSLSDSCVTGTVSGDRNVGGLVGSADRNSSISGSYATGTVSGDRNVGGLVGSADGDSSISGSYATSAVSGLGGVGGLVGVSTGGPSSSISISESYATGAVTARQINVGGLVGSGSVSISGSYATGNVSGGSSVGGLVGSARGSISGSYATGNVSGGSSVGGLVGSGGSISGSYATGNVSGGSNSNYVGGLVGSGRGVRESYATGNVSGGSQVGGLIGFADRNSFISGSHATGMVTGSGNLVGGLVGSVGSGSSIRESHATGTVSGGGGYVGGLVGSGHGSISGSYATGAVTGGDRVGGLVGSGHGSISGSYATGAVTGGDRVGGLVGSGHGSISGSYATGTVSGGNNVGGLAGYILVSISGSYATGTVTGNFRVGGLVGQARGNTSYSYAVGNVAGTGLVGGLIGDNTGNVTDSYWDTVTSGQSYSDGGEGKTTSELQSPTGYSGIYANWNADLDDADRDRNPMTGGDDPWDFGTSSQYPVLKYGGLNVAQQRR